MALECAKLAVRSLPSELLYSLTMGRAVAGDDEPYTVFPYIIGKLPGYFL